MVGLVLSVATIGCVKSDGTSTNQSGMMTLQLSNGTLTTRAVGTNDDTNNEDLIANAQVFFFESDAVNATVQHSYYTSIGQNQQASMSIPLSADQLTSLFPNNKSYVYVIANYGSEITGATTLAALKATVIASTFGTDADGVQDSFIMDSELVEVTRGDANTITGEVFLTRAAAKVELTVKVKSLTQDGKTWVADTANMKVSFKNGVNKGLIDDGSDTVDTSDDNNADLASADYFNIDGTSARGFSAVENVADSYVQTVPFYSYSTKWTAGAENEVYLVLAIPWKVEEQSASESEAGADSENVSKLTYQTFYYQVPVSVDKMSLVRNAYYKLTLDVGVLGGLTKPVTVVPSYVVIDWGTNNVNVTLSRPKYLIVDEKEVVLNNTTEARVGYQSSDAINAYIIAFKYYKKTTTTSGGGFWGGSSTTKVQLDLTTTTYTVNQEMSSIADVADGLTGNDYRFNVTWDEASKQVIFSHLLDNTKSDTDKVYHYLPYEVTVRVTNEETGFYEDIVFKQYPAMYISTEEGISGSVFVNKNQSSSSTGQPWYYADPTNTVNMSGNIYRITVSAFDASTSRYLICDPRVPSNNAEFKFYNVSNGTANTNSPVTTATDISGDKTLTGYRATVEGEESVNFVAPEFIIASAYGHYQPSWKNMYAKTSTKYRCAGYQEAGYPAGRWRIPTPAELEVIGKLCAEGKIESIFNDGTSYMSSNGPYKYSAGDGTFTKDGGLDAATGSVRCVYDTWYWNDKLSTNYSYTSTFLWGAEKDTEDYDKSQYLVPVE